ncbi:AI-2E family transporter [Candidatus Microgenomates bacterium]|nr:MAG: AI-2E family transporter [Candidatus Microgenomates bacterium]
MKKDLSATVKLVLTIGITLSIVFGLLFLLFRILSPFLFIFLSAFILSVFLNPLFIYLQKKLKLNKVVSAIIALFIFLVLVSIPLSIILTLLITEISGLLQYIQANAGIKNELTKVVYDFLNQWGFSTQNIEAEINKYVVSSLRFLSANLTAILSQTIGFILNSLLTLLVTFYFLIHKESIVSYIYTINPLSKEDIERLSARATEVMTATIRGNLIVILIQAFLGGVGFSIFGISSPVLLGAFYGLASFIPVVGITLIWVPAAVYLLVTGSLSSAAGLAIWCLGSNLLMDNVISPKILAGKTGLHPFLILFGVLGGIQMFGIFGVILGPTIIALSFIAFEMYRQLLKG